MAPILAHGVAAPSMSGYSARPDGLDHKAYRDGHKLYSRSTPRSSRPDGARDRGAGTLRAGAGRVAPGARDTEGGASIGTGGSGERKRRGHHAGRGESDDDRCTGVDRPER
ncbi:hypothetical protein DN051_11265 [Streptomyces cadmiisoli]|uniref:Uncharacterized protein n=1 Tax=Streptomyces cadmiisoli TaxID=2184053 RepID=A0A2Z4IVL0_9ACTN|nr:hypothetical protein DN051_11265 [Streptomyces cadmiisoli]